MNLLKRMFYSHFLESNADELLYTNMYALGLQIQKINYAIRYFNSG